VLSWAPNIKEEGILISRGFWKAEELAKKLGTLEIVDCIPWADSTSDVKCGSDPMWDSLAAMALCLVGCIWKQISIKKITG